MQIIGPEQVHSECLYSPADGGNSWVYCWATGGDEEVRRGDSILDFGDERYFVVPEAVAELIFAATKG